MILKVKLTTPYLLGSDTDIITVFGKCLVHPRNGCWLADPRTVFVMVGPQGWAAKI